MAAPNSEITDTNKPISRKQDRPMDSAFPRKRENPRQIVAREHETRLLSIE
jgi:hypothetical protein